MKISESIREVLRIIISLLNEFRGKKEEMKLINESVGLHRDTLELIKGMKSDIARLEKRIEKIEKLIPKKKKKAPYIQ